MQNTDEKHPLVVIGIDAGDPGFIQRWVRQGKLPHIASVMKRGCWGVTKGSELISEHGVWLSIFSGLSRSQHSYYYFRQLKAGTYDLESKTGMQINAPPFWTVWGRREDKRVAIIDIPDEGLRPELPGLQLINWASHQNWDPTLYPTDASSPELLREIQGRYGEREITTEKAETTWQEDFAIYQNLLRRVQNKGRVCRDIFSRELFDLYVTVFAETHAASHQFWRYCPDVPANANREPCALTDALSMVYQAVDEEIGKIIAVLPPDTNVVLVSSVGMADKYPMTGISETFFRKLGYQFAPPPSASRLHPLALARRVMPEWLRVAISRQFFSRSRREQLLADQFRTGTDWSRTRAFALPSAYTTFVRINLRGREAQGIVEPGDDYNRVLDEIEKDLHLLIEPRSGQPAVTAVYRTTTLFDCHPHPVLPDLFVEWLPGKFIDTVRHPRGELTQGKPDFFRRSDHSSNGFFAAAGSDISPFGKMEDIDLLAIAPTCLQLIGEPQGAALRGRSLPISPRGDTPIS